MSDKLPKRNRRQRLTREESKALTRSRLLESAHHLFAAKGFEGTAIDEIAGDAGYSRGAFYAHFPNKEAIMAELIRTGFEEDLAQIETMRHTTNTEEAAAAFGRLAQAFYEDPTNTLWMLEFQLAAVRHPELRPTYSEQFDRLRKAVAGLISDTFAQADRSAPQEADRFADVFISVLSSMSLTKILDPDKIDPKLFEDTFKALVRGIEETS